MMFAGGSGANQIQICFLNNYANLGSSYSLAAGSPTVYWLEKLSNYLQLWKREDFVIIIKQNHY